MKLGTKSVLYGAHCFALHPYFVAKAWTRLYGFPRDPRLWIAFIVHDLGYIGKAAMDDFDGELHPLLGARIMATLFDRETLHAYKFQMKPEGVGFVALGRWGEFVLFHSRFMAKRCREPYSRLCVADKMAIALTPAWLYLPMVTWTGEVEEYMATYGMRSVAGEPVPERRNVTDKHEWYAKLQAYMAAWAEEHRDGRPDTWSKRAPVDAPGTQRRMPIGESGVYQ